MNDNFLKPIKVQLNGRERPKMSKILTSESISEIAEFDQLVGLSIICPNFLKVWKQMSRRAARFHEMSSTTNESEKINYFQANFSKIGPNFRLSRDFQRVHITYSKILLDENLVSECSHRSKLQIEQDLRIFS